MPVDVPAHVQGASYVENHIVVDAGTNWDISRTARETPIVQLPDPEPVVVAAPEEATAATRFAQDADLPQGEPLIVVHFTNEGITILKPDQKALLALSKEQPLYVAAHGDAKESDANRLSRVRAKAVTTFLRSKGYKVQTVKAFGSTRPVPGKGAEDNQVVEIYAVDTVAPPQA
jgi:hypothetical protein